MSLRGRVGRHTQAGGRQCQNWSDDQQTVITLFNHIPVGAGGMVGLGGRIINGMASDVLYSAISQFEDRHFPGQRSGYIDPGGAMLKRMEEWAAWKPPAKPQPVVESPLDILRRNVLDDSKWIGLTAGELAAFAPLIHNAVKHIDRLKDQGFTKLAWRVELYGRAYTTQGLTPERDFPNDNTVIHWRDSVTGEQENPIKLRHLFVNRSEIRPLPEMSYFHPVEQKLDITTGRQAVLLLFNEFFGNACARVLPYRHGPIAAIGSYLRDLAPGSHGILMPVFGISLRDISEQIRTGTKLTLRDTEKLERDTAELQRMTEEKQREIDRLKRETAEIRARK